MDIVRHRYHQIHIVVLDTVIYSVVKCEEHHLIKVSVTVINTVQTYRLCNMAPSLSGLLWKVAPLTSYTCGLTATTSCWPGFNPQAWHSQNGQCIIFSWSLFDVLVGPCSTTLSRRVSLRSWTVCLGGTVGTCSGSPSPVLFRCLRTSDSALSSPVSPMIRRWNIWIEKTYL